MASRKLSEMIKLTWDYNDEFYHSFPDELLIAIFWEETLFQNIEQIRGATGKKGLGFGQVQEDTLPLIKVRMGRSFPKSLIVADDRLSVAARANPAQSTDATLRHRETDWRCPTSSCPSSLDR